MAQRLDFEFPDFDDRLGDLRAAAANLQVAAGEYGTPLRAYIRALKTLNAEMLGRLGPLLRALRDAEDARRRVHERIERRSCQGAGSHPQAVKAALQTAVSNRRSNRRMQTRSASQLGT
jgi:hypothetical protein